MATQSLNWPVDGHVHFHRPDRVAATLDAAARNFRAAGKRAQGFLGALLLTQAAREEVFESLAGTSSIDGWRLEPAAGEAESLIARKYSSAIAVVCGRQVRAADGLEVLGLGTRAVFPDGLPFADAIETVRGSGALTVIPWGFGKWLGRRGKAVEDAFSSRTRRELFVGDNGSRLDLLGRPSLVRTLEARGFHVLPGTDPFPFAAGERRVGGFGMYAEFVPDIATPWRQLRAWLEDRAASPEPYGRATGAARFAYNQFGIQVYNRFFRDRPG
jgi:hypothetical protein